MAIIYTYPVKGTPLAADLVLISDSADSNKSKNATIASLVTSNAIDVVDTLNSLKGDINITGGTNITVTPSGQNIEISTSASNVDGSGTANKIPMWSDSNTLTDSQFESQASGVLDIPNYIRHIGDTGNFFGFGSTAASSEFLVYTEGSGSPLDQESLRIRPSGTAIKTNATTRLNTTVAGAIELYYAGSKKFETTTTGSTLTGGLSLSDGTNNITISIPAITTSYDLKMPASIGTASQVLKLPSTIGTSPYQLVWGDASSTSGTGGFETLPFTTANGYITGETSIGTYVFQMIAPSNCAPANFKFYNFLAQSVGRTTTVAIYKGVIGDEGAAGSLQSTGQIAGTLGAAQISGSTLTVVDGATAISAGDNIVVCFSIDEEIQPLGVVPTTASGGITLTNASPISNSKLAIHDANVSLTAAQIQANATTVTALEALLTSSAATTTRPFLLIY